MKKYALILWLMVMAVIFFQCQRAVSVLTDVLISDQDEMTMGQNFHQQILENPSEYPVYTKNPAFIEYIGSLGQHIAQFQPRDKIAFTFTIIDDDSTINAFAVPGGYIYLYTGLIKAVKNEEEIAGVIAHEIAHVALRHSVKRLVRTYGRDQLLSIIFGGNKELLKGALNTTLELQYGKSAEHESDSCAVAYTSHAGHNPLGMKTFLETLFTFTGSSTFLQKLFSTHPPTEDRIADVNTIIETKYSQFKVNPIDTMKMYP